jgi:nicotinate-nucleotide adenylyltransferase
MAIIGLYFGSFNPIHIGHIAIAGYMTEFAGLDQVWFVVSPHNPLKSKITLLADHQRLHMVYLAVGKSEKLKASDIEFKLPVPSFTIDTLTYLKEKFPGNDFCLVMGEDNLYTLHKWKNIDALVDNYSFYVYPRPGSVKTENQILKNILKKTDIHMVNAPQMDLSSTFIREGIKNKKDMSFFLSPDVWKYITEMHFYEK